MEPSNILEKFVDSRGNVEELLSSKQLSKWFPKSTDPTTLQLLRDALRSDRERILNNVKSSIKQEFDVPLLDSDDINADRISTTKTLTTDKYTVPEFLAQLKEIDHTAQSQNHILDSQIQECIEEIEVLSQLLLQIAERNEHIQQSKVEDSLEAIDTLENLIIDRL